MGDIMDIQDKRIVSENLLKRLLELLEKQTRQDSTTILQLFEQVINENKLQQTMCC